MHPLSLQVMQVILPLVRFVMPPKIVFGIMLLSRAQHPKRQPPTQVRREFQYRNPGEGEPHASPMGQRHEQVCASANHRLPRERSPNRSSFRMRTIGSCASCCDTVPFRVTLHRDRRQIPPSPGRHRIERMTSNSNWKVSQTASGRGKEALASVQQGEGITASASE